MGIGKHLDSIWAVGTHAIVGIVILVAAHLAARTLSKLVANRSTSPEGASEAGEAMARPSRLMLASVLYWTLMVVACFAVLALLGVQIASVIALVASVGVFVGLALQGILGDVTAGVVLALTHVFYVGELIEAAGITGVVTSFNVLQTTLLEGISRMPTTLPNRLLQQGAIRNLSRLPRRRMVVDFKIANSSAELERIRARVLASLGQAQGRTNETGITLLPDGEFFAGIQEANETGVVFRIGVSMLTKEYVMARLVQYRVFLRHVLADAGARFAPDVHIMAS
jgi:small-conductance mechanosensitive channel